MILSLAMAFRYTFADEKMLYASSELCKERLKKVVGRKILLGRLLPVCRPKKWEMLSGKTFKGDPMNGYISQVRLQKTF